MRDLKRCLNLWPGQILSAAFCQNNLQVFHPYIDHLSLRMVFRLLIILQLPQNLFELIIPGCMIVFLRILQGLVLGLGKTVSTSPVP